jgi:hypothetical protein
MKQLSDHAAAAKMIRQHLKAAGIVATVRASTASMTSSVNVDVAEVLPATFALIKEFCERFCYETNRNDSLPQVRFVFVRREFSDATKQAAADYVDSFKTLADRMAFDKRELVFQALNGTWGSFWSDRKPRVRVIPVDFFTKGERS